MGWVMGREGCWVGRGDGKREGYTCTGKRWMQERGREGGGGVDWKGGMTRLVGVRVGCGSEGLGVGGYLEGKERAY